MLSASSDTFATRFYFDSTWLNTGANSVSYALSLRCIKI